MRITDQAEPLWGDVAEIVDGTFDGWTVSTPRVDGNYRIARSVIEEVRRLPSIEKAKLTTWVVDQHRLGELEPLIHSEVLRLVSGRPILTYRQKVSRFLAFLRRSNFGVGNTIRIAGLVNDELKSITGRLSAWLEIDQSNQLYPLLTTFTQEGLLSYDGSVFRLTAAGLMRLDDLASANTESDQAFVAMWFSKTLEDVYVNGIEAAILDNGYTAMRIDRKEHLNKIDDEILSEIRKSRFLVADFTCELFEAGEIIMPVSRGGVYYEAGFAQALGIPVIWCVRADCINHVHFDTRQFSHIVWENADDLRVRLRNRIGATIGPRTKSTRAISLEIVRYPTLKFASEPEQHAFVPQEPNLPKCSGGRLGRDTHRLGAKLRIETEHRGIEMDDQASAIQIDFCGLSRSYHPHLLNHRIQ